MIVPLHDLPVLPLLPVPGMRLRLEISHAHEVPVPGMNFKVEGITATGENGWWVYFLGDIRRLRLVVVHASLSR
ncbi:MAG: hypothetical protein H8E42_05715 [Nitrospinae bacterium]|nr:hypothetical protein [Nitrospinota bacterium]MBL7019581.1 hypothetical protein [Nitrospinaceae bacterium]